MPKTYDAHLFICTNRKGPGPDGKPRACCAAKDAEQLRDRVKAEASRRFSGQSIRVNASGCLGACEEGIAAVCYSASGGHWQVNLENTPESSEVLLRTIEEALDS
jgi:predicted metal-binding protein